MLELRGQSPKYELSQVRIKVNKGKQVRKMTIPVSGASKGQAGIVTRERQM